jgi:seryl-tRNA synthetase
MLDIRHLRENLESVQKGLADKNVKVDLDEILDLDRRRRELIQEADALKATRNRVSREIADKQRAKEDAQADINEMREVSTRIKAIDADLKTVDAKQHELMLPLPNLPHESVPFGESEDDNKEIGTWGEIKKFSFEPKDHLALGESLDILDFPRGTKIAGSGFPLYKGLGARLERALINFMLDLQTDEHGYREIFPPFLANRESMTATGQLPKMADDMYHAVKDDLFVIPTAEVPITKMHRGEILPGASLPVKYAGYSACFRREAGSYGRDVRGFLRVHQFNKVELVQFVHPDSSYDVLDTMRGHAEEVLRRLNLPYRILNLCTADLSFASAKTYDLEVWSPAENKYLECSSVSNFEDFQARRGSMRFRDENNKVRFMHTLNGSGLATSRLIVALMETYQNEDGSITIPEVLRPWMGGRERIA